MPAKKAAMKMVEASKEQPNKKRASRANTSVTLDAVAVAISLVLFVERGNTKEILAANYNEAQNSPEHLTNLSQDKIFRQGFYNALRAAFPDAAMFAALTPAINKYTRFESAEDVVNFLYLGVRLLRKGIARPSPQINTTIWEETWKLANKKKPVKEKRSLLIKNRLTIDDWKRSVESAAERKFLRMVKQFEGIKSKSEPILRSLEKLFPDSP